MAAEDSDADPSPATVEMIAAAYLEAAGDDPVGAVRRVVTDALVDLCEAERRTLRRDRLISRGYVRGRLGDRDG